MLNKNYNCNKERDIYVITNFLNDTFANKIGDDMIKISSEWWYVSMFPINQYQLKQNTRYYDGLYKEPSFIEQREFNKDWFNSGSFAYTFKRSIGDHYSGCYCIQCKIIEYFNSDEIRNEISKIVGEKDIVFNETFSSKYETNDYLSIHDDKGNGDYAFVFQLTKDWNPSYGGLLNFYDRETKEVYKTVNPIFNSLTIFKVKNIQKTDHFVSMNVSSNTRYAYAGWFSSTNA